MACFMSGRTILLIYRKPSLGATTRPSTIAGLRPTADINLSKNCQLWIKCQGPADRSSQSYPTGSQGFAYIKKLGHGLSIIMGGYVILCDFYVIFGQKKACLRYNKQTQTRKLILNFDYYLVLTTTILAVGLSHLSASVNTDVASPSLLASSVFSCVTTPRCA